MIDEEVKVQFDEAELETLHKIHTATAIKQTIQTPGWDIITEMIFKMVRRLEDQHLAFAGNATRDAYWASGLKLAGAREALTILQEQITKEVNLSLTPPSRTRQPED